MIAKITKGTSAHRIGAYLHGLGKREEHHYDGLAHGRVIASNLVSEGVGSHQLWARTMSRVIGRRVERAAKPVWQASLRAAPEGPHLTDAQWGHAARTWLSEMGAGVWPYVVVRHGADHVHIVLSRVGFDQSLWNPRHDYRQAQTACRVIEADLGLREVASGRNQDIHPLARVSQAERVLHERGRVTGKDHHRASAAAWAAQQAAQAGGLEP